jgi:hypothetical protein
VQSNGGPERVETPTDHFLQFRKLGSRRPRVLSRRRDSGDHVFVKHMHVPVESTDAVAHLDLACLEAIEPLVDLAESLVDLVESPVDLLESLVDLVESPVDLVESPVDLLESLVEFVEPLVDSAELLFRHALLRSRDDDDTSSGG